MKLLNNIDGADKVKYDNTTSGLSATDVQSAIDDVVVDISGKAPLASPTFTGTVAGVTAAMVGLGNVTNESKATMFTSPTFTGVAKATGNTSYTTSQLRNVFLSTTPPTSGDGANGDIWMVYTA